EKPVFQGMGRPGGQEYDARYVLLPASLFKTLLVFVRSGFTGGAELRKVGEEGAVGRAKMLSVRYVIAVVNERWTIPTELHMMCLMECPSKMWSSGYDHIEFSGA
ncbi:hypothetical protein U9M48_013149, partial [Paspalum notatum var. saurae]